MDRHNHLFFHARPMKSDRLIRTFVLMGVMLFSLGAPVLGSPREVGGPDAFGYVYRDSQSLSTGGSSAGLGTGYGDEVAMDGDLMVVGEGGGNRAYVYRVTADDDIPIAVLENPLPTGYFGRSLAISGNRVVVGDSLHKKVYLYDMSSGTPSVPTETLTVTELPDLDPSERVSNFGYTVAISGTRVVVGEFYGTRAYVYDLDSPGHDPEDPAHTLVMGAGANGSANVAISGTRVVVGDRKNQKAYVYDLGSANPATPEHTLGMAEGSEATRVAMVAIFGTRVVVGDRVNAKVYVYDLGNVNPTTPTHTLSDPSGGSYGFFGISVGISGTRVVVGGPETYIYDLIANPPEDPLYTYDLAYLPYSVANSGTNVLVGSYAEQGGTAYLYTLPSDTPKRKYKSPFFYPNPPTVNFTDLSYLAANVSVAQDLTDEENSPGVPIGFPFRFYGQDHSVCYPHSNGNILFGPGATTNSAQIAVGTINDVKNFIAPFWVSGFNSYVLSCAGTNSGVYYATLGDAPDRIFIVQYKLMDNCTGTEFVSLQVKLFEGSNAIEFQYDEAVGDIVGTGGDVRRAIGIQDPTGTVGLEYVHPYDDREIDALPSFPFAIRFEHPVAIVVESTYKAPDGSTRPVALFGKLSPNSGVFKIPYGTRQSFKAPKFVYLNKDLVELDGIGDLNDPDPDKVAHYRVRNVGYAIDGENTQGTDLFFERTITRDYKVIWRWELEYGVVVESATGDSGLGSPVPGVGRNWIKKDDPFAASIDRVIQDGDNGVRVVNIGYELTRYPIGAASVSNTVLLAAAGEKVAILPVEISEPLKIKWLSEGEVRYRFDASRPSGSGIQQLNGEPFVRVYDEIGTNSVTYFGPNTNGIGAGPNMDVWIPLGRKVDVGCFYRTADRCFTLASPTSDGDGFINNPSGDLPGSLTLSRLVDTEVKDFDGNERVARVHTVPEVFSVSEIHWLMSPTVFRALVPLGQGLDARNPNRVMVPDLCGDAALLRMGDTGPAAPFQGPTPELSPSGVPSGDAVVWDAVGKSAFPVQPGSFQFTWPDAVDADADYAIELVSGFAGKTYPLRSFLEEDDGMRVTSTNRSLYDEPALDGYGAPLTNGVGDVLYYSKTYKVPDITDMYPGAPDAHYRHIYDTDAERRPPTKLDISTVDRWKYVRYPEIETPCEQLFDLKSDPREEQNLASDPANAQTLSQLRKRCDEYRQSLQ